MNNKETHSLVKAAVYEAVLTYNRTILGKNAAFLSKASDDEKKGIFYNTLRREISIRFPTFCFVNSIKMHHLGCFFKRNGELNYFRVVKKNSHEWIFNDDIVLVNMISEVTEKHGYFDNNLSLMKLTDIINSVKNIQL